MAESDHGSGATASPNMDGAAEAERMADEGGAAGSETERQETCASCRFYALEEPNDDLGECRALPPQFLPGAAAEDRQDGVWPLTCAFHWCGAWASREPQR